MRRFAFIAMISLAAGFTIPSAAIAQQGYEFGIRFQDPQFATPNFKGFSFQQPSFATVNTTPIQFNGIRFPAFNSQLVRRLRDNDGEGTTAVGRPSFVPRNDPNRGHRPQAVYATAPNRLGRRDPFAGSSGLALQTMSGRVDRRRIVTGRQFDGQLAVSERSAIARVRSPFLAVGRPTDVRGRRSPVGNSRESVDYRSEHLARGRFETVRSASRVMPLRTVDSQSRNDSPARR